MTLVRAARFSEGQAGRIHAGDRLPWVPAALGDNFVPLASLQWQVHVYGSATRQLAGACAAAGLALHEFSWNREAARAGLARDASYLLRPDGYVALADPAASAPRLGRYLEARELRLEGHTPMPADAHAPM